VTENTLTVFSISPKYPNQKPIVRGVEHSKLNVAELL